jgi:hypothetical protein
MAGIFVNQEDSLVFNKTGIERGLFRSTSLKKYMTSIQKNQSTSQDDVFMKPDPTKVTGMRHGSYDKLNDKGYVPEETVIYNNDIILGKVTPIQPTGNSQKVYKDSSEVYKSHAPGVVDKVYTNILNNEGYEIRKMRIRSERIPRSGDKFCFLKKHEALTDSGWKYIEDLKMTDKIAVLEDNMLKYVNPIGVYNRDYDGKIYELDSTYVRFAVTADHQLYVKQRNAKEFAHCDANDVIGKRVNYKVGGIIPNNPRINNFVLPITKNDNSIINYDMDAFLVILGIYMAEGWHETKQTRITFSVNKERVKKALKSACEKLNLHIIDNPTCQKWHIANNRLTQYFKLISPNNKAVDKKLPDFVWNLASDQCQILINSMRLGDGTAEDHVTACYYTSSKLLADDVQRLCIHAGWSAMIRVDREKGHIAIFNEKAGKRTVVTKYDSLCVNINKNHLEPLVNPKGALLTKQIEQVYDYKGKVYCLEVPSHIFMMRYNGKISLCGQCSRH